MMSLIILKIHYIYKTELIDLNQVNLVTALQPLSNTGSVKWLRRISVVNTGNWQKFLNGVDCHTSQSADMRMRKGCCSYTRDTDSPQKYKTKMLQNIQKCLDIWGKEAIPSSSYWAQVPIMDCCPPWILMLKWMNFMSLFTSPCPCWTSLFF